MIQPSQLGGFQHWFRQWRRNVKSRMPYVRRREYRILQDRHTQLLEAIGTDHPMCNECEISTLKAPAASLGSEVCLFVTYAPLPVIKRHVLRNVEALLACKLTVVLIVNTPHSADSFQVENSLLDRLGGFYVRANHGFDFAAWCHVHSLIEPQLQSCERLLITNDSIVGPLGEGQLERAWARVQASEADVVGLTESTSPRRHLQSFFLVFQRRALRSRALANFWRDVRSLPSKQLVIDFYETFLTHRLRTAGLVCQPLFALSSLSAPATNDIYYRWTELLKHDFPYIKASVLEEFWSSGDVTKLVPAPIREEYEFANANTPKSASS